MNYPQILESQNLHPEKFIVNNTTVNTHEAHEVKYWFKFESEADCEEEQTMSEITKHHSKEDGDRGEDEN